MADGVVLNAGSGGVTAATDDCGASGHAQVVKLAISTDGSATLIPATAAAGILVDQSDDATRDNGIMTVDNGGTFAVQVDGNALTALQLIDDIVYVDDTATHSTGTSKGALMMAAATPTDASVNANDIGAVAMTTDRKLHVAVMDALPAGTANIGDVDVASIAAGDNNIGNVDIVSLPASTNTLEVVGDAAHDAAAAGNPLLIGAKAETALSGVTAVADGDATVLYAGADGVLITRPYCGLEDILSGVDTDSAGDSTSVIAAQGAGIRTYVTSVIVKNTHASTDAYIDLRDGTAGSVLATIPAPAAGGAVVSFPVPLRFTANTAVAVDPSAAVSTIITTVIGFKAAV
jgi:hypothetical protein